MPKAKKIELEFFFGLKLRFFPAYILEKLDPLMP
jgi:hypothetical protein